VKVIVFFSLISFIGPCILTMLCLISAPHQHDMSRFVFSDSLRLIISAVLLVYLLDMFKVSVL
jgi:hypothetical protein